MTQNGIRKVLEKHPIIPVATIHHLEDAVMTMNQLLEQQIHCIEVTLRTECAMDAIKLLKSTFGHRIDVGVGTVTTAQQLADVEQAEVDFIVSPGTSSDLRTALQDCRIPFIPGVVTPSEIMEGISLGWDTFKFFPASQFGGKGTLQTYAQVFPNVRFCPTGGINQDNYADFQSLSNVVSVGGSWMLKK
jgi:2-dehydro-3-deoxyphosphogluconate aldolase/(4S)-4-hydroxy-2-oxoglutarate aldolase